MKITKIELKNWMNFKEAEAKLSQRTFIVGGNASGKSNFLDAFRFLHDIADGRLQDAVAARGGMRNIRCLHATNQTNVGIAVEIKNQNDEWSYSLEINNEKDKPPHVVKEIVFCNDKKILTRPDETEKKDPILLSQTFLEQVSANAAFRPLVDFFKSFNYLHIVPQVVRHAEGFNGSRSWDVYGRDFIDMIARTPEKIRNARLKKINNALASALPEFIELKLFNDESGRPHISALYKHWRKNHARQLEKQFSDGTLRLMGILWMLLENRSLLMLEEPELSLHPAIIEKLPALMYRSIKDGDIQILTSTHSPEFLSDTSILGEEVLVLMPGEKGTKIMIAAKDEQTRILLQEGMPVGEAVMPLTRPRNILNLDLNL